MSNMKNLYIDLVERYPLPLHKYMEGIPESLQEDALELWKQNHSAVCQCYY
jgi:hypothetical protein